MMKPRATWLVSSLALCVGVCTGCTADKPGDSGIPRLTVDPTSLAATATSQPSGPTLTPPTLPTSPSCALLTKDEVRAALGGGEVQQPFGTLSPTTTGFAGLTLSIDMCSWQQHAGEDPGRVVQVEVHTAHSTSDADQEYQTGIQLLIEHTAPGSHPVPVSGLGSRADRLPEWLVTQKAQTVCAVTITPTADAAPPDPALLEDLAHKVTSRLGW